MNKLDGNVVFHLPFSLVVSLQIWFYFHFLWCTMIQTSPIDLKKALEISKTFWLFFNNLGAKTHFYFFEWQKKLRFISRLSSSNETEESIKTHQNRYLRTILNIVKKCVKLVRNERKKNPNNFSHQIVFQVYNIDVNQ